MNFLYLSSEHDQRPAGVTQLFGGQTAYARDSWREGVTWEPTRGGYCVHSLRYRGFKLSACREILPEIIEKTTHEKVFPTMASAIAFATTRQSANTASSHP